MPKKKKALPKEKTQKQRFIEKAKELGVDPDKFDRVFKRIAPKQIAEKKPRS